MNVLFSFKQLRTLLAMLAMMIFSFPDAVADAPSLIIKDLGEGHCLVQINTNQRYLLLPVEEVMPDVRVSMIVNNKEMYEVADMIRLTPAYDLLNAAIINPKDDEELALTLNGRKKKLQREDFIRSAATLGIENVIVERLINKYIKLLPKFETVIQSSFLSDELKEKYGELLKERLARLSQKL